jgi:hypothetical protein
MEKHKDIMYEEVSALSGNNVEIGFSNLIQSTNDRYDRNIQKDKIIIITYQ